MVGLAISTYIKNETYHNRFEIFKRSLTSLKEVEFGGSIFLVDDASPFTGHLDFARSLDIPNLEIIERTSNGGISKTKNTGIKKILDSGCNIGFLSDDDMIFHRNFDAAYVNAMNLTGIHHMSYFYLKEHRALRTINGVRIHQTPHVNGCFLTFTRALIERIGYFKVLPYSYGHEHSNFTIRAGRVGGYPFFCDIENAQDFLTLDPQSIGNSSIDIDIEQFNNNELRLHEGIDEFVNCEE